MQLLARVVERRTLDGQAFYQRSAAIFAEVEEAENAFRDTQPRGLLRALPSAPDPHLSPAAAAEFPRPIPAYLTCRSGQGDPLVDLVSALN
jgi:DNA-binding transcriptional LysR family regulator